MAGYTGGGGSGGGGGGAPTDAQYVTLATDGGLANERVLTAGTGISLTDGGAGGNLTIANTVAAGAPPAADYVTLSTDGGLSNERVLTAGTGISLTDGGAGGNITIAATGGAGGKVLQVVQTYFTGDFSTNSTSYVDVADGGSTLEATITPSAATSKILIALHIQSGVNNAFQGALTRIWNGSAAVGGGASTEVDQDDNVVFQHKWSADGSWAEFTISSYSAMILDSPATTSAITYTVQQKVIAASQYVTVNKNPRNGNYLGDSPAASSITLFEIGV